MSTALQLQFFMVQAVNYSVIIIVKIKCKTHNITNRKRLPWCELINLYIFFIVSVFHHTSRKTSRRDVKAPETLEFQGHGQRLGSFNVSSRSRFGLGDMGLGTKGLVHIPGYVSSKTCPRSPSAMRTKKVLHRPCLKIVMSLGQNVNTKL